MNRDELIKFLIDQYKADEILAFDIWNVQDVKNLTPNAISREEAKLILIKVYEEKDCTLGLSNDVFHEAIADLLRQKYGEKEE